MSNVTTWTPEAIRNLLTTSNAAVERGLVVLYERQTADEQASQETNHQNGVGFNGTDAHILSSFVSQINSKLGKIDRYSPKPRKLGECLSPKQLEIARKKILKYARQLAEAANEKGTVPAPAAKVEISQPATGKPAKVDPVAESWRQPAQPLTPAVYQGSTLEETKARIKAWTTQEVNEEWPSVAAEMEMR